MTESAQLSDTFREAQQEEWQERMEEYSQARQEALRTQIRRLSRHARSAAQRAGRREGTDRVERAGPSVRRSPSPLGQQAAEQFRRHNFDS